MQLTAITAGFFGTGSKSELYSLSLFHQDGDQVRRYGSLISPTQTPPARQLEQAGLNREQLEQAPQLEQVWGEVRRYFTPVSYTHLSSEPAAESGLTEEQKVALSPLAESMSMDPATMTDSEWMQVAQAAQSQQPGNEEPAESDSLAVLEEMGIDPSTLSEEQLAYLSRCV